MLYVEPIYIQGAAASPFPIGRAIVVAFGEKLAWSDTLDDALNELFGGQTAQPPAAATPGSPQPPPSSSDTALTQALADAQQAMADADAALKAGDFAKYGEAQQRLKDAITRAAAAQPQGSAAVTTPPASS